MRTDTSTSSQTVRVFRFGHGQFINGGWRDGSAGRSVRDMDPYSGDVLAQSVLADASDADDSYKSAQQRTSYRKPVGVVGVIISWNWPFQLSSRSVFPGGDSAGSRPPERVLSVVVGAGRDVVHGVNSGRRRNRTPRC